MSPPPRSEITVRAFEMADIPALHEAWSQPRAIWGTLLTPYMALADREKRFANPPPGSAHLVAVLDGRPIGSLGLHREERPRRAHAGSIGMAVHDAHVGKGAGTALMTAAIDLADNWWNLKRIELGVFVDNAAAIGLYERFGFEREGIQRAFAWRNGEYVDTLAMARLRL